MCSKKQPKLLTRSDLNTLKFNKIKIIDLKHSLRENAIRFKANNRKKDLYDLLKENLYSSFLNNIDIEKLTKVQSYSRKWILNRLLYYKGPGYFNKKLCQYTSETPLGQMFCHKH